MTREVIVAIQLLGQPGVHQHRSPGRTTMTHYAIANLTNVRVGYDIDVLK
ncbi:hypothetical protein [Kribbella endophytica]